MTNAFFEEALQAHVEAYRSHFGDRLAAVYVRGSVFREEAVPGVSDLDLDVFINTPRTEEDRAWHTRTRETLDRSYPHLSGLAMPLPTTTVLQGLDPQAGERERNITRAYVFRLTYDARLLWGTDLLRGVPPPVPSRDWIHGNFEAVRDLVRYTAGLEEENRTDFDLPQDEALRLRKLARLGVLAGAYLLMAQGETPSFRGTDVFPKLQRQLPAWNELLEETEALYIVPVSSPTQRLSAYLPRLVEWTEWVNDQIASGIDLL